LEYALERTSFRTGIDPTGLHRQKAPERISLCEGRRRDKADDERAVNGNEIARLASADVGFECFIGSGA
jgi:hypothetical protein